MFKGTHVCSVILAGLVLSIASLVWAQSANSISVSGAIAQPLTLTASDLAGMPRATVTTKNNGITRVYEGVWVSEVLKKAGMKLGTDMRGSALATYVLASAS